MKKEKLLLKCPCGKSRLVADAITLRMGGVPFKLTPDGPEYDDSKANYSEGWDFNNENACQCASCGEKYVIDSTETGKLFLTPANEEVD